MLFLSFYFFWFQGAAGEQYWQSCSDSKSEQVCWRTNWRENQKFIERRQKWYCHGYHIRLLCLINNFPITVLVNAVYFKAKFEHEFNPNFTRPTPFFLLDGTSVNCQMMCFTKDIGYQVSKGFQAVKLNYKGQATNLQIFLPTEKGPKVCKISLTNFCDPDID